MKCVASVIFNRSLNEAFLARCTRVNSIRATDDYVEGIDFWSHIACIGKRPSELIGPLELDFAVALIQNQQMQCIDGEIWHDVDTTN